MRLARHRGTRLRALWRGHVTQAIANPDAAIAIVVEDLAARRDEIRALADDILCPALQWPGGERLPRPYNLSLGTALSEVPLVAVALDLLGWSERALPLGRAAALLRSPFIAVGGDAWMGRAHLEPAWIEAGRATITMRTAIAALLRIDPPLAQRWAAAIDGVAMARKWITARACRCLAFRTCGHRLARQQAARQPRIPGARCMGQGACRVCQPQRRRAAHDALGRARDAAVSRCERRLPTGVGASTDSDHRHAGSSRTAVRRAVARGPHCRALAAGAATESNVARCVATRAKCSARERCARARVRNRIDSAVCLRGARRGVLVRAKRRRSRMHAVAAASRRRGHRSPTNSRVPFQRRKRNSPGERRANAWRTTRRRHWKQGVDLRGGARLIEAQSDCPFKGMAIFRLGAETWPTPVDGLSALERGVFVHAALAAFWRAVKTRDALVALSPQALRFRDHASDERRRASCLPRASLAHRVTAGAARGGRTHRIIDHKMARRFRASAARRSQRRKSRRSGVARAGGTPFAAAARSHRQPRRRRCCDHRLQDGPHRRREFLVRNAAPRAAAWTLYAGPARILAGAGRARRCIRAIETRQGHRPRPRSRCSMRGLQLRLPSSLKNDGIADWSAMEARWSRDPRRARRRDRGWRGRGLAARRKGDVRPLRSKTAVSTWRPRHRGSRAGRR